ncbi:MAG: altronate dehydrogenase [bacterium]|nr:altronate dehydrogenase [bacterium]
MKETLLQFGGGNFLRAFVDLMLHEANADNDAFGRVVVVTSTSRQRSQWINQQKGCYHVVLRGLQDDLPVDETITVSRALQRSLPAADAWPDVLAVACSAELSWIVSNTTEAGLTLDPADTQSTCLAALDPNHGRAPHSFPAKLLAVLACRLQAGLPPVTILPCELLEDNGPLLLELLRTQAGIWKLPADLLDAVETCPIPSTLVDRIVSGRPDGHPLRQQDQLLTVAEPYASWVIEDLPGIDIFPHAAITITGDVSDYALRKVRILNGAHTALVCMTRSMDIDTVSAAVAHADIGPRIRQLLLEEILPVINDRVIDAESFVETTLERFANPYLHHRLADVALHHETKVATRLLPTYHEHVEMFGAPPPLLGEILQPYL